MKNLNFCLSILFIFMAAAIGAAQDKTAYDQAAQRAFIPSELGKVYLGMPIKAFAGQIDLSKAEIDDRFEWISVEIPFNKGNVTSLVVKVHGVDPDIWHDAVFTEKVKKKAFSGDYEAEVKRIRTEKLNDDAIVYAMYITFKEDFDLKSWALKTYGEGGHVTKPDDQYRLADIEWVKTTDDGLQWLIRSLHVGKDRTLQLLGRIPGTEWGVDDILN